MNLSSINFQPTGVSSSLLTSLPSFSKGSVITPSFDPRKALSALNLRDCPRELLVSAVILTGLLALTSFVAWRQIAQSTPQPTPRNSPPPPSFVPNNPASPSQSNGSSTTDSSTTTHSDYHSEASKYHPQKVFTSPNKEKANQRLVGQPFGCTHFACLFLGQTKDRQLSNDLLKQVIETPLKRFDREPDVRDAIANTAGISLLEDDPLPWMFVGGIPKETIKTNLLDLLNRPGVDGSIITTGNETFALRFTANTIELFDSHGDANQQQPSFAAQFSRDQASSLDSIAQFILDRGSIPIHEYGQLDVYPVKYD